MGCGTSEEEPLERVRRPAPPAPHPGPPSPTAPLSMSATKPVAAGSSNSKAYEGAALGSEAFQSKSYTEQRHLASKQFTKTLLNPAPSVPPPAVATTASASTQALAPAQLQAQAQAQVQAQAQAQAHAQAQAQAEGRAAAEARLTALVEVTEAQMVDVTATATEERLDEEEAEERRSYLAPQLPTLRLDAHSLVPSLGLVRPAAPAEVGEVIPAHSRLTAALTSLHVDAEELQRLIQPFPALNSA